LEKEKTTKKEKMTKRRKSRKQNAHKKDKKEKNSFLFFFRKKLKEEFSKTESKRNPFKHVSLLPCLPNLRRLSPRGHEMSKMWRPHDRVARGVRHSIADA